MHEMSIAHEVVQAVEESLPGRRILTVTLQVGVLAAVVPEALRFGWEVATKRTALAGSRLVVDLQPLPARCLDCGARHPTLRPPPNTCPDCTGDLMPLAEGRELCISTVEIEDVGPAGPDVEQEPSSE
jgi:hydrogenase nickel incorporation protein HypA/HybF